MKRIKDLHFSLREKTKSRVVERKKKVDMAYFFQSPLTLPPWTNFQLSENKHWTLWKFCHLFRYDIAFFARRIWVAGEKQKKEGWLTMDFIPSPFLTFNLPRSRWAELAPYACLWSTGSSHLRRFSEAFPEVTFDESVALACTTLSWNDLV